jgi:hypothetical protein
LDAVAHQFHAVEQEPQSADKLKNHRDYVHGFSIWKNSLQVKG